MVTGTSINMKTLLYDDDFITLGLEGDNIPIGTFKVETLDIKIARHVVAKRLDTTNYKQCITIADVRSIKKITKEARDFMASEQGCEGIIATAIIIDSPLGMMLANFYISINKPLRPVKLFTNIAKAKKWLSQFADE